MSNDGKFARVDGEIVEWHTREAAEQFRRFLKYGEMFETVELSKYGG